MNSPKKQSIKLLLTIPLLAGLAAVQADVVLEFDSTSYVSADTDFQRKAPKDTSPSGPYVLTNSFSDSSALSPSSGYTGPVFYGGYDFTSTTINPPNGISRQEVRNNYQGTDQIVIKATNFPDTWEGSDLSLHAVYLFKQVDFNPGYTTGNIGLDGLSVSWGSVDISATYDLTGYYLVQKDDTYYLSHTTFDMTTDGIASLSGASLDSETWAVYDPATNLNFDQSSASYNSLTLENITSVGIYYEDDLWAGGTNTSAFDIGIKTFAADGTVIPESSHVSLLLGLAGLLCFWRFRSCKRC